MKFFIAILSLLTVVQAKAAMGSGSNISFHLPFEFRTRSVSTNGGAADTTQYFNVIPSLGYQFSEMVYLGVNYRYTNETGSSFKSRGGVYGPQLGLNVSNFYLGLAYYFGGQLTNSNGGVDTNYTSGSGGEVSVAYLFPVASNFAWGPQFTYADIKYTGDNSISYEVAGIEPYLALFFYF